MDSHLDFSAYIADRTKDFTGREWIFAEIDRWLTDPDGPPFLVVAGEPGIGKSAIAARLTQIKNLAARHFCIARQADTIDPVLFAQSLSQQLCCIDGFARGILKDSNVDLLATQNILANYGQVIGVKIENLTLHAPSGSAAFTHAVLQPLKTLCADGSDRQVVLLVDALDEAVQHKGSETIVDLLANMGNPPRQVRVVLTSRPEGSALDHFEQRRVPYFLLNAGLPENLGDIRLYVRNQLAIKSDLRARLAENQMEEDPFIERVTAASRGNFLYLVWLLLAIAAGTQRFDALAALPQGLDGIYREFLRTRRVGQNMENWREVYRPIVGILAAAQAPLRLDQLRNFTGLGTQAVRDGLQDLAQFLDPVQAGQEQYALYHQSVADFLQDSGQAGNFWVDLIPVHQIIADWYWSRSSQNWTRCDDYGFSHLATHLWKGNQYERLSTLIDSEWLLARTQGPQSSLAGFLRDVDLAWQAVSSLQELDAAALVRLRMAKQLVIHEVTCYTDVDLQTLVWLGRADEAVEHAQLRSEPLERYLSCMVTYRTLREVDQIRTDLLQQALDAALSIQDAVDQSHALQDVVIGLMGVQQLDRAWAIARDIPDGARKSWALLDVTRAVSRAGRADDALDIARSISGERQRAEALAHVASAMAETGDERAYATFGWALETAHEIDDSESLSARLGLSLALLEIAPLLAGADDKRTDGVFAEAIEAAFNSEDQGASRWALPHAAAALARAGRFDQAIELTHRIHYAWQQAWSLREIATALAQAGDNRSKGLFSEALQAAQALDEAHQTEALCTLATALSAVGDERASVAFSCAMEAARSLRDQRLRARAQCDVGVAMTRAGDNWASEMFKGAEELARSAKDERTGLMRHLALALAQVRDDRAASLFAGAQKIARVETDELERSRAVSHIVAALAQSGHYHQALNLADTIQNNTLTRSFALKRVVAALAKADLLDQALSTARRITDNWFQPEVMAIVCAKLLRAGDTRAEEIVAETLKCIHDTQIGLWQTSWALRDLASVLLESGRLDEALQVTRAISREGKQAEVLLDFAVKLEKEGHPRAGELFSEALMLARTVDWNKSLKADITGQIAAALARARGSASAIEFAHAIQNEYESAEALRGVAMILDRAGDGKADEVFMEALEIGRKIRDVSQQSELFSNIVEALTQTRGIDPALEAVQAISDWLGQESWLWWRTSPALIEVITKAGKPDFALSLAQNIKDEETRAEAMRMSAVAVAEAGQIEQALRTAHTLDERERSRALQAVAATLAKAGDLSRALQTVEVSHPGELIQVLATWAPEIEKTTPGSSEALLREACAVAGWVDAGWRGISELL